MWADMSKEQKEEIKRLDDLFFGYVMAEVSGSMDAMEPDDEKPKLTPEQIEAIRLEQTEFYKLWDRATLGRFKKDLGRHMPHCPTRLTNADKRFLRGARISTKDWDSDQGE